MFDGLRFSHWYAEHIEDGVILLTFSRAGSTVNSLNRSALDELSQIVERLNFEPPRGLIIRSDKTNGFIAGADIHEFEGYEKQGQVLTAIEYGQKIFQHLAQLRCPSVAAIHGHCLGGGAELALACRYRVASRDPSTRIGLPEVKLGIHPGWGGTARLPRLIGAPQALELMLTGRSISAEAAQSLGIVNATATPDALIETAKRLLRHRPRQRLSLRFMAWASNLWPARQILAPILRKQTAAKVRSDQYPAPFAIIECWRRQGSRIGQRLKQEARSVARLAKTPTCHNLMRVFFLQEQLKALSAGADCGIQHIHVIGAGVMGGDIAAWCALQGFEVTLQDREMQYIQPALDRAAELYRKRLKTPERIGAVSARLKPDVTGQGLANADLVIEAIFENLVAKQELYRTLEPQLKPTALLATNTSSIPLAELLSVVTRPKQFLGLHYFNPVALMPLVEIVCHDDLDANVIQRALAFAKRIDKLPVPVKSAPGFLVNRVLMPYLLEAMTLYSEGVPAPVLDKAAKRFGMPMGPIELADTIGLDVAASVGKILAEFLNLDIPQNLDILLQSGKRGKKDGQGFYTWQNGKPVKPEVPATYRPADDITERLILPMLNEAVACLHEGVVATAELLDAGVIFGTGFAPFRGGPIHYIRSEGAQRICSQLEKLAEKYGNRFTPKAGWDNPTLQSTTEPDKA